MQEEPTAPNLQFDRIPLFWHVSDNFGDAMAPWLVEKITGRRVVFAAPDDPARVPYVVTGSLLGPSLRRGIVWGTGCAYEEHLRGDALEQPSPEFKIVATRGPLSRRLAQARGHEPRADGDPGLLLPRFFQPATTVTGEAGILCSWINEFEARSVSSSIPIVGSLGPVEEIVSKMLSWEVVLAGCLHALVTAVAYRRPVCWVRFDTPMLGDGFKFRDFFASLGVDDMQPIHVRSQFDIETAIALAKTYEPPDTDALMACCPFAA